MVIETPGRTRLRLEAYFTRERAADDFQRQWGGRVEAFTPKAPAPARPIRVDARLEVSHDEDAPRGEGRLIIPYGMAFGSGEHATTLMLLRALARAGELAEKSILDLGTGSGVLALAARAFGARTITGTDFDPAAIRTARQNERLNFSTRRIRWEIADARKLPARPRYDLILANLFSGVLIDAAPRLARALEPGGELWLSGVLRSQQEEVASACERASLRHLKTSTRGKWVMQQWAKSDGSRRSPGNGR
jgi:ribosomal protein L11 methyltransferase